MQFLLKLLFIYSVFFHGADTNANSVDNNIAKSKTESKQISIAQKPVSENKININLADLDALQTIKGIGPKRAQAILDYRSKNGLFNSIEDLAKVKGFNEHLVAQILKDNPDKLSIQ